MLRFLRELPRDFWYALGVWIVGMVIAAPVTFPNHYFFRTGYDLGIAAGMFENISKGCIIGTTYSAQEVPRMSTAAYILGFPFYWLAGYGGLLPISGSW